MINKNNWQELFAALMVILLFVAINISFFPSCGRKETNDIYGVANNPSVTYLGLNKIFLSFKDGNKKIIKIIELNKDFKIAINDSNKLYFIKDENNYYDFKFATRDKDLIKIAYLIY